MSNKERQQPTPFRVLAVCTGNICRSPLMAALLRAGMGEEGEGIAVTSAGTSALIGHPVHSTVVTQLNALGLPTPREVARQLTAPMVDDADLVLTAERAHRSRVVRLSPRAVRRTFTLLEFAELARLDALTVPGTKRIDPPALRFTRLLKEAPRLRAERVSRDDDIADPFGRDEAAFQLTAERIGTAVRAILDVVPI